MAIPVRQYASSKGMTTLYDDANKYATIKDPITGKTITFNNSNSANYGITFNPQKQYNEITDTNKFDSYFAGNNKAFSEQNLINQQIEAMRASALQNKTNEYNQSTTALADQQRNIAPTYNQARTNADVQSQLLAKRLKEQLINRGVVSGQQVSQMAQNVQQNQANLGQLNMQEIEAQDRIKREQEALRQQYQGQQSQIYNQYEGERFNQLLNSRQRADELGLRQAELTGNYNNMPTLRERELQGNLANQEFNQKINEAGITGSYNNMPTLESNKVQFDQALKGAEFSEGIRQFDEKLSENKTQFDAQMMFDQQKQKFTERQAQIDNAVQQGYLSIQEAQQQLAVHKQEFDQSIRKIELTENMRQFDDNLSEKQRQFNTQFTFDQQKQSFAERQTEIENAVQKGYLTVQEAQLQLARDKYVSDIDPYSVENEIKREQLVQLRNQSNLTGESVDANSIIQQASKFLTQDTINGEAKAAAYIENSGLPPDKVQQALAMLSVKSSEESKQQTTAKAEFESALDSMSKKNARKTIEQNKQNIVNDFGESYYNMLLTNYK